MKTLNKIKKTIIRMFMFLLILVSAVGSAARIPVYAEEAKTFEQVNVLDDLKEMTLNGKAFNVKDYAYKQNAAPQFLTFIEYGYSINSENPDCFGLYVYVYNPSGVALKTGSRNKISLSTDVTEAEGGATAVGYSKFDLQIVNESVGQYAHLFYKLKIETDEAMLEGLNSVERAYAIGECELLFTGEKEVSAINVGKTYIFNGYAKGCGADASAESSLECRVVGLTTLNLDVFSTIYRPEGNNGKNDYTQDSLHSVYFAVPNEMISKYGEMTAVHASWLNAVTAPIFVTGNIDVYDQVSAVLGENIWNYEDNDVEYSLIATKAQIGYRETADAAYTGYIAYNVLSRDVGAIYDKILGSIHFMYYAETGDADNYVVTSEKIGETIKASAEKFGGELVNEKYAACMFESVDDSFTDVTIRAGDEYRLTSNIVSQTWWQELFGLNGSQVQSSTFDGISAIYAVNESDLSGSDEEISKRLFISSGDVEAFKKYYKAEAAKNAVYLFRYQTSEYVAYEVTEYIPAASAWASYDYRPVDTNAYFAQETVNLDFDVIDVTFNVDDKMTVIPVVSAPIDIFGAASSPLTTSGDGPSFLYKLAAWGILIGGILVGVLVLKLLIKMLDYALQLDTMGLKVAVLVFFFIASGVLIFAVIKYAVPWIVATINRFGGLK